MRAKDFAMYAGGAILAVALVVGLYWLAKHGSYWLWYEDMVKETIQEMVKTEALKGS